MVCVESASNLVLLDSPATAERRFINLTDQEGRHAHEAKSFHLARDSHVHCRRDDVAGAAHRIEAPLDSARCDEYEQWSKDGHYLHEFEPRIEACWRRHL